LVLPALSSILPRWPEPPLRSSAASSTSAFMPAAHQQRQQQQREASQLTPALLSSVINPM
jgi:hypothetical protein